MAMAAAASFQMLKRILLLLISPLVFLVVFSLVHVMAVVATTCVILALGLAVGHIEFVYFTFICIVWFYVCQTIDLYYAPRQE